jgi:bla regulator protein BlaR1
MIPNYLSSMWTAMAPALGNHLWQSTAFAIAVGLLTLVLRNNHARIRHLLWLIASVKFLIPFSLLAGVGSHFAWWRGSATANAGVYIAMDQLSQPFSQSRMPSISEATPAVHSFGLIDLLPALLAAVWLSGFVVVVLAWYVRWRRFSAVMRKAMPLREGREVETLRRLERAAGMSKQMEMRESRTSLEPGILGIVQPVLVWPQGISERLENGHLEAILAHELCHVRRRDNLSAAVHMVVEAIFWFHPMVWWLGVRLVEERERACDEQVLEMGTDWQIYAESILKICEFCIASPLDFVSGVTGADLQMRIVHMMAKNVLRKLDFSRKLLLGAAGLTAVAIPIVLGLLNAAQSRAESKAQVAGIIPPVYEAVSIKPSLIKPNKSGSVSSRMVFHSAEFTAANITLLELMGTIYGVEDAQIVGAPSWFKSEKFDMDAKWDKSVFEALQTLSQDQLARERRRMLQEFLADRFKLAVHRETEHLPVYDLLIAPDGPKLQEAKPADTYANGFRDPDGRARGGTLHIERGQLTGQAVPVALLVRQLSGEISRELGGSILVDKTGLTGNYDFTLRWIPEESQPSIFRGTQRGQQGIDSTSSTESARASLFTALQQQLGLKLELQNGPGEILVIDHVEKPAAPEAQGAYARAPVFQVASIKPSESVDGGIGWFSPDQYTATGATLQTLLREAYGVQDNQISGAPDWLNSEKYAIEAKMDKSVADEFVKLGPDQRDLERNRMLQALFAVRFKLSLHRETRDLPAYALVIAKNGPKLQEARPGDTYPNGIKDIYGKGHGDVMSIRRGQLTGQGVSIGDLVQMLSQLQLGRIVLDKTGLKAKYDFTLQWTPDTNHGPTGSRQRADNTPPPESSGPSIFTTIQEQLGLKLESQTTPVEMLMIDHAERPSEI